LGYCIKKTLDGNPEPRCTIEVIYFGKTFTN